MIGRYSEEVFKVCFNLCRRNVPDTAGGVLADAGLVGVGYLGGSCSGGIYWCKAMAATAWKLVGGRL